MTASVANSAVLAAAAGIALCFSAPGIAAEPSRAMPSEFSHYGSVDAIGDMKAEHKRKRKYKHGHWDDDRYYGDRDYRDYDEPIYRDTRIWRGRDGRYYCRRDNGTTGLLIGAGVGGLVGNEVAGRGDKALGTLLGAVGGAILGREIDRGSTRCR